MWQYFTVAANDSQKATCTLCVEAVSRGGVRAKTFNTTNLWSHLSTHHPEQFKQLEHSEESPASSSSQPSLAQVLEQNKPLAFNHPHAVEITTRIGEMVAVDNEPSYIIEHAGFKCLMTLLEPRYSLPSSKYLSEVNSYHV